MVDVKVAVAVVAVGTHEDHAFVRKRVDEQVAEPRAVGDAPLWQAPAVIDHESLAVGLRHAGHPLKCVQGCGLVDHQGCEQEFRGGRHARQPDSRAAPARDARHVRAVGRVPVNV